MGGRGGSMGGSHGLSGGGGAAKAAAPKAPAQTREQKLLAQIKGNPAAILKMSDQDAADTVTAIAKQRIRTDGTQINTFVQRYLNAVGFSDSKPQLLSDSAYERARMKAKEASMYQADKKSGGKTGDHYNSSSSREIPCSPPTATMAEAPIGHGARLRRLAATGDISARAF